MIDIIQAPIQDSVIPDGNDTVVKVRSTLGSGSYISFSIFVNDELLLGKSVSKKSNGDASLNLQHLYDDYFENAFTTDVVNGFKTLSGLKVYVKIFAEELRISDGWSLGFKPLPGFYIIKATRPMEFNSSKFQLLDVPVTEIPSPRMGALKFPFYAKSNVIVTVTDDEGTVVLAMTSTISEPTVKEFNLNLASLTLPENCAYIKVRFNEIISAASVITIPLIVDTIYPVKQLFYLNNCGAYLIRWIVGKFKDERKLSPENYLNDKNTEVTYEIGEEAALSLNSGYHSINRKNDILAIAKSLDVRLKINGSWLRVAAATKKVPFTEDGEYLYEETLNFTRTGSFTSEYVSPFIGLPKADDVSKSSFKNQLVTTTKAQFLAIYTGDGDPTSIRFRSAVNNGQYGYEDADGNYHIIFNSNTQLVSNFAIVEIPWKILNY